MAQNPRRQAAMNLQHNSSTGDSGTTNIRRNLFSSTLSRRGPTSGTTTSSTTNNNNSGSSSLHNPHHTRPNLSPTRPSYELRAQTDRDRQILLLSPSGSFHLNTPPPLDPSTPLRHHNHPDEAEYHDTRQVEEQYSEEHRLIESYRKHRAQVEMAAEVRATLMNSLLAKVQSLSADAWMFGDDEEEGSLAGEMARYGLEGGEFEAG